VLIETVLCRLEALGVEGLDRVRRPGDERLGILVRLEVGEHPVCERAPVATLGTADADA
jgi:hypothetical protein